LQFEAGPVESPRTIDKYELVEKLGEGGFGVVYKARHQVTQLLVAIKILVQQPSSHPDVATRFRREASIGNLIGHENIVRSIDFGEVAGQPYLVLEFLDGESLADAVRTHGPMAPARVARIALQVADALAAAHAQGVIHRDLKPENIFLVRQGGSDDFVKVLDFGIAKLSDDRGDGLRTRSHMLIGSPVSMSPEQCRGADIDHRSDVYALGVVMFYAVSGRYPFFGAHGDVLSMHLRDAPPRLSDVRPGVPEALAAVVARALAKHPDERFASMEELARALGPLRSVADTTAAATVRLTPPSRPRRRRPRAVALSLAGVALLVGLAGAALRWRRATAVATTAMDPATRSEPPLIPAGADGRAETVEKAKPVDDIEPSLKAETDKRIAADEPRPHGETSVAMDKKDSRTGYLTVAVLPFAEVAVDGRVVGATPLRKLALRPGEHTVDLVNAGLHRRVHRVERIEPGAHRRIQLDWSR
jgi:serine/threonine-protein kinase